MKLASTIPGIRRHGAGWQAAVKVRGERSFQQFPFDAKPSEMQAWQQDERARLRLETATHRAPGGTFPADVQRYLALESIKKMPTYAERVRHLREWVSLFGDIRRRTITALMIEQQRDAWLEHYSAASVNKRLRALSNVYTKLDGRRGPNPVLDVAECEEPDPEARGLPYDVIEAILAEIPETYIGTRKDGTRTPGKMTARQPRTRHGCASLPIRACLTRS